ncbi:MAG: ROK family protein [Verrucomicrobia bacterium]|nr:MAG: ROK family protein [Verrucomicrobiota bacterium]
MDIELTIKPELDPDFVPAVLWNKTYREQVAASAEPVDVALALVRPDKTCSVFKTRILPLAGENEALSLRYLERILKFLLWQRGGCMVLVAGCDVLAEKLSAIYSSEGARSFDYQICGEKIYDQPLEILACDAGDLPEPNEQTVPLGRHLDGCRIGFDLGGSDRKCAAVIDGKVVFSEEVEWNPYFESDPAYHIAGINDTLERAAAHLPQVDAIGGSSAGVYVNNEVRAASLFRGVPPEAFEAQVRRLFFDLKEKWNNIPFDVVNDGEVTALAGSMSMGENAVLGLAMGTSQAVGYVSPDGNITPWLNELAFAPVDYREDAPVDEWSGDAGCGVQYFSQQAVARLVPLAGLELPADMPFPEQLVEVQKLMAEGDDRPAKIYSTIGTYLGYGIAHYADFYKIRNVLLLGRVTSGQGGTIIIEKAREVLDVVFPELAGQIEIVTPNEKEKRHGQAVAAASLPSISAKRLRRDKMIGEKQ